MIEPPGPGPAPDGGPVLYVDEHGRYVDESGYWVDEHGRYVDEDGRLLDGADAGDPATDGAPHHDDGWDDDGRHDGGWTRADAAAPHPAADGDVRRGRGAGPGQDRRPGGSGRSQPGAPRSRRRRRRHPVLATLGVLVVAAVIAALVVGVHLDHEIRGGRPGGTVAVVIPTGSSTEEIGQDLARAGIITGPSLFRYYVGIRHAGPLLGGHYRLATHEGYSAVVAALTAGPATPSIPAVHLVIPEGFTLQEIAARVAALDIGVSAAQVMAASSTGAVRSLYEPAGVDDLEGLLFPATYDVTQGMTAADILQLMVGAFEDHATQLDLTARAAALGMTPYDVVKVASIVEREAKLDADRGGVASAIYNRLKDGMTLGADSTLVYALRQSDPTIDVGTIDYNQPNPYNTRLHTGLPPTPIANPGLPSLTAAIDPPATSYLYFVEVNPDGKLGFASTSSGFDALTAQCQAAKLC